MPLRPGRKELYGKDWAARSLAYRAAAGHRCEVCGAPAAKWHGVRIVREAPPNREAWHLEADVVAMPPEERLARFGELEPRPIACRVTVAHRNHDETDHRPENLAALCELHHNRHDGAHRAANRRRARQEAA